MKEFFEIFQFTLGLSLGPVPAILIVMWVYNRWFYEQDNG